MNRLFTATALLVCLSQAHGLLPAALHSAGPSGVAVFNGTLTLIARNPEGQLIESGSVTINDARFLYPGLLSRLQPTHMPLYGSRFGGNSLDAYNAPSPNSMSFHGQRLRRSVQDGPDDIPSLRSELDSMYKLQNTLQNFKQELSAFESSESSSDESTSGQNRQKRQAEGGDDDGSSPTCSISKMFKSLVNRMLDFLQKQITTVRQRMASSDENTP